MLVLLVFGVFLLLMALGAPVAMAMGLAPFLYITFCTPVSPLVIVQQTIYGVNSYTLLAIPLFVMAGVLMELGGISKRLVRFCMSLVGHYTGGLAMVVVIASAFFAAMTGSAIACTAAIGGIMIPEMIRKGYDPDFSCALQATGGIFGPLIPPSIVMVIYAINTNQSVGEMLLAGATPGVFMAVATIIVAVIICRRRGFKGEGQFSWREVWVSFKDAIWAILTPAIILGGIYTGLFTPTEAAGVSCFYALIVGVFIYRELSFKQMLLCLGKAMKSTGNIMLIVASSFAFSFVLSREHVATLAANWMLAFTDSKGVFLLVVLVIMLIAGCFVDASPTIMILAPLFAPIAEQYGVSLVHLGGIMVSATSIGLITPPLGLNMFLAAQIGDRPIHRVIPATVPFMLVTITCLIILTYVPQIVTFLPGLLH